MVESESTKPYTLTFERRREYLYVHVKGKTDNYEISRRYWQEIAEIQYEQPYAKLLVVEDLEEQMPSMTQVFMLANELPDMGFRGVKLAFADSHVEQREFNEFAEIVAVSRGLFCKVFKDAEKAEQWLLAP